MILSPVEYQFILQRDFTSFIERAFYELNPQTRLIMSAYIEVLATKLEACRRGEIHRLIVNVPPRHLKSHCASVCLPAWILGHQPWSQVICASYGQELADKLARDCRTVMQSAWYQTLFPTRLLGQAVHDFLTTEQGVRMATSIEGVLTGRGGDFIIIDDPTKPEEALSESRRSKANQWFDNTLLSRLNNKAKGCIIIVMQRLHQDDLVGHVLELDDWGVVSFPAIAEEDETHPIETPLGRRLHRRAAGEILHPERESRATLANIRQQIGEYNFQSQYQQNPTPVGGAIVKTEWLHFYAPGEPPKFSWIIDSWDSANKADELNDYSVCTSWGLYEKNFYLLDVFRQRLNFPELKRKAVELFHRHQATTLLIEDKASGTQLIQELQREVYGVKAYEPPKGMDKIMRLYAVTPLFENGFVHLPISAPWLTDFVRELTSFPGSKYDDQVDSTTQALDYLRGPAFSLEVWARLAR